MERLQCWLDEHRNQFIWWALSFIIALLVSGMVILFIFSPQQLESKEEELLINEELIAEDTSEPKEIDEEDSVILYVDIKGAVHEPGVYQFDEGARVLDAVEQAGGLKPEADERQINLAQLLTDQMLIIIPKEGEEITAQTAHNQADFTEDSRQAQININTASAEELVQLKGIGQAKAENIINYREENGSFQTIEDIMSVSGIGEGIYAGLKDQICID